MSHQTILKAGWRRSDKPIPSGLRKERHRAIPLECLPSALSSSSPTLPAARKAPLPLALTGAGLGCGNAAPGNQGVSRWPTTVPLFDRGGCSGRVVSPGSFSHFHPAPRSPVARFAVGAPGRLNLQPSLRSDLSRGDGVLSVAVKPVCLSHSKSPPRGGNREAGVGVFKKLNISRILPIPLPQYPSGARRREGSCYLLRPPKGS